MVIGASGVQFCCNHTSDKQNPTTLKQESNLLITNTIRQNWTTQRAVTN